MELSWNYHSSVPVPFMFLVLNMKNQRFALRHKLMDGVQQALGPLLSPSELASVSLAESCGISTSPVVNLVGKCTWMEK